MATLASTVTVVIPVLNRERLLPAALDSIAAQTLTPLEVLVIDGGSTDGTLEVARRYSWTTVIELPGADVAAAHNAGIGRARGALVAFAASDDLLHPEALARHVATLEAWPAAGVSLGRTAFFADQPHRRAPAGLAGSERLARVLEAMAVRRQVFDSHGLFREDLGPSTDLEWVARIADGGVVIAVCDAVVVSKRLHQGNNTYGRIESREVVGALHAVLARRRGER